jgi:glycerate-2-kinase
VPETNFYDRADKVLTRYSMLLPADVRQLLRDMAATIDQLTKGQK